MLSLGFVTGVEPDKWVRRYRENTRHGGIAAHGLADPVIPLIDGRIDVALVRLPDPRIDDRFHVIELYDEEAGIAVPKDSVFAEVGDTLGPRDVDGETVNYRIADDGTLDVDALRTALQVVAANVGIALAPRPALKVLSKKQVVHLGYRDRSMPVTRIALAFPKERDSDAVQDFVGVAKGRTANSSRQAAPKRSAREKTLAKQQRREQQERGKPKPKPKPKSRRGRR